MENKAPEQKKVQEAPDQELKSPERAVTAPLSQGQAPDANVGLGGNCVLDHSAEMARPDSGEPCDDGRGIKPGGLK